MCVTAVVTYYYIVTTITTISGNGLVAMISTRVKYVFSLLSVFDRTTLWRDNTYYSTYVVPIGYYCGSYIVGIYIYFVRHHHSLVL